MNKELFKRILSSIILLPIVFYCLLAGSFFLIFLIIICLIVALYEWNAMNKNKFNKIFGFIYLLFSFYTFYNLSTELFLLMFVILICISTDIGGYIFGKIFKGPKITKISPKKNIRWVDWWIFIIFSLFIINFKLCRLFGYLFSISFISSLAFNSKPGW